MLMFNLLHTEEGRIFFSLSFLQASHWTTVLLFCDRLQSPVGSDVAGEEMRGGLPPISC